MYGGGRAKQHTLYGSGKYSIILPLGLGIASAVSLCVGLIFGVEFPAVASDWVARARCLHSVNHPYFYQWVTAVDTFVTIQDLTSDLENDECATSSYKMTIGKENITFLENTVHLTYVVAIHPQTDFKNSRHDKLVKVMFSPNNKSVALNLCRVKWTVDTAEFFTQVDVDDTGVSAFTEYGINPSRGISLVCTSPSLSRTAFNIRLLPHWDPILVYSHYEKLTIHNVNTFTFSDINPKQTSLISVANDLFVGPKCSEDECFPLTEVNIEPISGMLWRYKVEGIVYNSSNLTTGEAPVPVARISVVTQVGEQAKEYIHKVAPLYMAACGGSVLFVSLSMVILIGGLSIVLKPWNLAASLRRKKINLHLQPEMMQIDMLNTAKLRKFFIDQ